MKSRVGFLVVGLVLGILAFRWFEKPVAQPTLQHEAVPALAPVKIEAHPQAVPQQPSESAPNHPIQMGNRLVQSNTQMTDGVTSVAAAPEADRVLSLRLEDRVLRELEDEGGALAHHAYVEVLEDGWKIHVLQPDHVLAEIGLQDGDVITYDGIDAEYKNAQRAQLATRLVTVLKSIGR